MPSSFDKFVTELCDGACDPYRELIHRTMSQMPTVAMVLRWHWEGTSAVDAEAKIKRTLLRANKPKLLRILASPPTTEPRVDQLLQFVNKSLRQMADMESRVTCPDLRDNSAAAREVVEDEQVIRGMVSLFSSTADLERVLRAAMSASLARYSAKGLPVMVPQC